MIKRANDAGKEFTIEQTNLFCIGNPHLKKGVKLNFDNLLSILITPHNESIVLQ